MFFLKMTFLNIISIVDLLVVHRNGDFIYKKLTHMKKINLGGGSTI